MAAPLYAEFIVDFPEFANISQVYIEVKLAEAEAMLDELAFGEAVGNALYNIAVGYKAAHLLALSPYGQQLQLTSDDGSSVYMVAFEQNILPLVARRGLLL
jgi:hypothetical protein